ncbi:MAG TPA: radical SAM protein [Bryobacteraceae bacterium]|nr:radical SAM protein [Bryobacteraceae bacterium]
MRVLLIWPHNSESVLNDSLSCCEPLPFEYLAGALRGHHDVVIHDQRLDGSLSLRAQEEAPGLVGVAVPYTTAVAGALALAREAKSLWPHVPIVLGGHHVTVSRLWLDDFPADYVVAGEGGEALNHLANSLEKHTSFRMVPGLAPFHRRSEVLAPSQMRSLDELPLPDRSITRQHRRQYFHSIYKPVALVRFSAGCPYRCTFCILWRLTNQRYLTKQADRIVRELSQIEVDNVYVVDDEAFIQPKRMLDLAQAVEGAGIRKKYHMYVRADTAVRNPAVIERWAEIGLDSVLMGAESMEEQDLLDYQKAAQVSDTRAAMQLFHRLGIKVRANFIVRPEYTEDDFERLSDTVRALAVDLPSFAVLTPLPGTVLFEEQRQNLISNNPDLFDCYHTLLPTRIPLWRFYDRLACLLETASNRSSSTDGASPGVFYFSNNGAFERMVGTIRGGDKLHQREWQGNPISISERTTPCTAKPATALLQLR